MTRQTDNSAFVSLILLSLMPAIVQASDLESKIDTVLARRWPTTIGDCRGYYHKLVYENGQAEYQWSIVHNGKTILTSPSCSLEVWLYIFSWIQDGINCAANQKDITRDGVGEIIFEIPELHSMYVYSLDTAGAQLGVFEGAAHEYRDIHLRDLDGDSVPEFIAASTHYDVWSSDYRVDAPSLAWIWDGKKYRLANFKLSEEILEKQYGLNESKLAYVFEYSLKHPYPSSHFDPDSVSTYPMDLLTYMLELAFAGRSADCEELLEYKWPFVVSGRENFREMFWKRVESDPMWPELQQSDW